MAGLYLVSTPAAASHGKIHWLCGCWKSWSLSHVVSLHVDGEELSYLELPSEVKRKKTPLLGNSADGGLLLLLMKGLHMSLWKHKSEPGNGSSDWVHSEKIYMTSSLPIRVLKMHAGAKVRLEIFQGKSGAVVLWIEGEGLFLFSLSDRWLRKIDNEHVTKKYRFCPYEIDWLSCLAVINLVIDGLLPLDAEREKAQRRWRTLVAKNIPKKASRPELQMSVQWIRCLPLRPPCSLHPAIPVAAPTNGADPAAAAAASSPAPATLRSSQEGITEKDKMLHLPSDMIYKILTQISDPASLSTGQKEGRNAVRPLSLGTFIEGFVASLNFYEPIVSQDSFLVLCHCSRDVAIPDVVRVCNPLTGEVFHIPDLIYRPRTDNYALLSLMMSALMGRYPDPSDWLPFGLQEIGSSIPTIAQRPDHVSSSASAGHGCIHWLCGNLKSSMVTHVVTLHVDGEELSHLELPSEAKGKKLLANSADGSILLLIVKDLQMSLWKHKTYLPINNTVLQSRAKVTLEIFQGKSGAVVLWVEKEGLFLFSLSDRSVRKLDNERVTTKYRLCPYEMDWVSCLVVTKLIADGSASLDVGRKKLQGRWRTLMTKV
ncbi:hypothetical protein C2845_PM02G43360 [Panicum miliaceum]|uniref:DUF7595 domain-containing protein n=1 Tax=Panicum miliaceum TaxID=4540 RepID=A0A3L6S7Q7_PANMI|nr:hypothetical protein C2845_PM02G43360 [Panicum miliaceum]